MAHYLLEVARFVFRAVARHSPLSEIGPKKQFPQSTPPSEATTSPESTPRRKEQLRQKEHRRRRKQLLQKEHRREIALSAMQGKQISAEIKVKPWALNLVSLPLFLLSFPSLSVAGKCKGASTGDIALSYNLLDEFGEQTSVARMGGTLNIVCKHYGDDRPGVKSITKGEFPSPDEDGKLRIKIEPENVKKMETDIYCYCAGDNAKISNTLKIKKVLCSPIQSEPSPCSKSELCHLEKDGKTRGCMSSADLCLVGDQDPLYPYHLWIPQASSLSSNRYCGALKKAENEESGQVELDNATPELQTWISKFTFHVTSFRNLSQVSNGACR